ncbi:hypothetical protein JCM17961_04970 [Endothiovibrio diazotrophicus]
MLFAGSYEDPEGGMAGWRRHFSADLAELLQLMTAHAVANSQPPLLAAVEEAFAANDFPEGEELLRRFVPAAYAVVERELLGYSLGGRWRGRPRSWRCCWRTLSVAGRWPSGDGTRCWPGTLGAVGRGRCWCRWRSCGRWLEPAPLDRAVPCAPWWAGLVPSTVSPGVWAERLRLTRRPRAARCRAWWPIPEDLEGFLPLPPPPVNW